jgi:hypothetical protein
MGTESRGGGWKARYPSHSNLVENPKLEEKEGNLPNIKTIFINAIDPENPKTIS